MRREPHGPTLARAASGFHPGPPHHYRCKGCGHALVRKWPLGVYCPACHSLRVARDWRVVK